MQTDRAREHRFDSQVQAWLFPQVLAISKQWLAECLVCKDNCFPQMLLLVELAHEASDRIYRAIVHSTEGENVLKPILFPYDTMGSTQYVDFDTTRPTYRTREDKCHVSHVVADTGSWEQKLAQSLEEMDEVLCYVKNQNLGFHIPYTYNGEQSNYLPDFIARIDDWTRARRLAEPDSRSHRAEEEGQGGEGRHRAPALGAGRQQPRRLRAVGVPGSSRSVGHEELDPKGSERT